MTAELNRRLIPDLAARAGAKPETPAVIDDHSGITLSYGELLALTFRCRALYQSLKLSADDRVMSLLPNSAEQLIAMLGALCGGLGFAPIAHDATAREIRLWAKLTRPSICLAPFMLEDGVRAVLEELGVAIHYVPTDGHYSWLNEESSDRGMASEAGRLYVTTSGSTGDPKAIVFDGDTLWASGAAFAAQHAFVDDSSRFLNLLPMHGLAGLFNLGLLPLSVGACIVIREPVTGRTILDFWQTVDRYDISVLWLIPSVMRGLLALNKEIRRRDVAGRSASVKACFLGIAPSTLALKAEFEDAFCIPVLENYALSETTFCTTETITSRSKRKERSVGEVLPYVSIRLIPASESTAAANDIYIRSPFRFLGYLGPDGKVQPPPDFDGYFPTQDMGSLTDEGTLTIEGRRGDFVKRGAVLVSMREIEAIAEQHPAIAEAAAVSLEHPIYGETLALCVRLKDKVPQQTIDEDFGPWLRQQIGHEKWPEKIVCLQDFPRAAGGKVQKHHLADIVNARSE